MQKGKKINMNINNNWISNVKILSKDELNKLIEEVQNGSKEAEEKILFHNIRLVIREVLTKFNNNNVCYDEDDLISIGCFGLLKAVKRYDTSKGFEFSTYAIRCIDNEILMFLRKLKRHENILSINEIVCHNKDGDEQKIEDLIYDESDLVENFEKTEIYEIIRQIVNELPEKEKTIIMLKFGFYNNQTCTQKEISDKLHIPQTTVSRIIKKTILKIKRILKFKGIIEFHNKYNEEAKCKRLSNQKKS